MKDNRNNLYLVALKFCTPPHYDKSFDFQMNSVDQVGKTPVTLSQINRFRKLLISSLLLGNGKNDSLLKERSPLRFQMEK